MTAAQNSFLIFAINFYLLLVSMLILQIKGWTTVLCDQDDPYNSIGSSSTPGPFTKGKKSHRLTCELKNYLTINKTYVVYVTGMFSAQQTNTEPTGA
jgi:hypothetical protein